MTHMHSRFVRSACSAAVLVIVVAVFGGCGGDDDKTGAQVKPTEGQVKAQNNMEDFMKKGGAAPKRAK